MVEAFVLIQTEQGKMAQVAEKDHYVGRSGARCGGLWVYQLGWVYQLFGHRTRQDC